MKPCLRSPEEIMTASRIGSFHSFSWRGKFLASSLISAVVIVPEHKQKAMSQDSAITLSQRSSSANSLVKKTAVYFTVGVWIE